MEPKKQIFIAEIKTHSPFGFESKESIEELIELAITFGDMISVHFDPRWHGSLRLVENIANKTSKPILAKGYAQNVGVVLGCLSAGATHVLTNSEDVESSFQPDVVWFEPNKVMWSYCDWSDSKRTLVVNSRDMNTGVSLDDDGWKVYKKIHKGKIIQASNIRNQGMVYPDADGFIVGQHLKAFIQHSLLYAPPPLRN